MKIVFAFVSSLYRSEDRSLFDETELNNAIIFIAVCPATEREKQTDNCLFFCSFLLLSSSLSGEYLMTRTYCDSVLESEVKMAALNVRL